MTEKAAAPRTRVQRKDPAQEAIVRKKDELNHQTTELIKLLIELKRGWNGRPAPGIGLSEKITLTQPLPDQVVSSGERALQELSNILQGVRDVDQMQDSYSSERMRRSMERMQQLQGLEQQASLQSSGLEKLASSRLSRILAHIVAPFSTEKGKWERLRMLRALATLDRNLKELNDKVLSGRVNTLDSVYLGKQLYLDAKTSFFEDFRNYISNSKSNLDAELADAKKILKEHKIDIELEDRSVGEKKPAETKPSKKEEKPKEKAKPLREKPPASILEEKDEETPLKHEVRMPEEEPKETPKKQEPKFKEVKEEPREKEVRLPTAEEIREKNIQDIRFMADRVSVLYNDVTRSIGNLYNEPDPWGSRIYQQMNDLNNSLNEFRASSDKAEWVKRYINFVNNSGALKATLEGAAAEVKAKEVKPDFESGSTFNEKELEYEGKKESEKYIKEILDRLEGKSPIVAEGASNTFTRWWKRLKTNLSRGKDRNIRLKVDKHIQETRSELSKMMDILEKRHLNFNELAKQSYNFYSSIINMYDKMVDLAVMYNSYMRIEKSHAKQERDRFGYDLIPITDINSLSKIRDQFKQDRDTILSIFKNEKDLLHLHKDIEDLVKTKDKE